tara:strand:+ start:23173 stop:24204 length:1032 start_codon:yes stop_codon:yes gene_type:complete
LKFTFPDNKAIKGGVLKNVSKKDGNFIFEPIDDWDPLSNSINIDNTDYIFTYLNKDGKNKGGNSIILKLFKSERIDPDNIDYGEPDLILKVLRFKKSFIPEFRYKSEIRFLKEIDVLEQCKRSNHQNIVKIFHSGECKILNPYNKIFETYLFYTMENGEKDLKEFIELNHNILTLDEKVDLCLSLANGIKELYDLGFYHRDIKPDNIFIIGQDWKIGDLGLVSERSKENEIDEDNDFIGPRGWISPEVMNKYLCYKKGYSYSYDCNIDHKSDIFQLGKLFWFILQHNVPIGTVKINDFQIKNSRIYPILKTMLNYDKSKRYDNISEIILLLKPIQKQLLKKVI